MTLDVEKETSNLSRKLYNKRKHSRLELFLAISNDSEKGERKKEVKQNYPSMGGRGRERGGKAKMAKWKYLSQVSRSFAFPFHFHFRLSRHARCPLINFLLSYLKVTLRAQPVSIIIIIICIYFNCMFYMSKDINWVYCRTTCFREFKGVKLSG